MDNFDGIEFWQGVLTALFLASLTILVPKLLTAFSTAIEAHNPHTACWIDNLHRHNPFQQWMAERKLEADLLRNRIRLLDERTGMFLDNFQSRVLVCPTRKWILVCLVYAVIFVSVTLLGALTIMWEESKAVPLQQADALYPAFPATEGVTDGLRLRGNCMERVVDGSGEANKVGFVMFQICVDVTKTEEKGGLLRNEVRAKYKNTQNQTSGYEYYKLEFFLETVTKNGIEEGWKIDQHNKDRLVDAPELVQNDEYLKDCDEDCEAEIRKDNKVEKVMGREALKRKVRLVERKMLNYNTQVEEFQLEKYLFERRTRLKTEAWVTMLAVSIVALLWSLVSVITSEGETDYATVTRMNRDLSSKGPTSIATVLEPGSENKPSFVVYHHPVPDGTSSKKGKEVSVPVSPDDLRQMGSYKPSDFVDSSDLPADDNSVLLKVAKYSYAQDSAERARPGMIVVAYRADGEDY